MGDSISSIGKFFKAVDNTARDISNGNFDPKKMLKKQGILSNGHPNCVFDPNISASAASHKTAAGEIQ